MTDPTRGRWWIVVAAVLVQLALGAVYAWSVFNKPLQDQFGWSKSEAVLPFEVVIGTIFIGSLIGGRIQDRRGPRPVALGGVVLYSVGVMLASLVSAPDQLWLLVLTYGVMGGIGLGAAYITPIAMLAKWFPDRRGLITGIAVAGFGFGAVITAPVAKALLGGTDDKTSVFLPLGIAYLIAGADRRDVLPQPAGRLPGARLRADGGRPRGRRHPGLHAGRGAAHPAVVHAHRDPGAQRRRAASRSSRRPPTPPRRSPASPRRHRGEHGRRARPVQRRRPGLLGVAVGPDRPDAGVPRHARAAGDLLLHPAARRGVRPVRHPRRAGLPGVRRRLRHHAGDRGRLLRHARTRAPSTAR